MYIAIRNVMSSVHHTFAGILYSNGEMRHTRIFEIDNVTVSEGVGDTFCDDMLSISCSLDGH